MSLDRLAPELLSLILQQVDSPVDLYHFISASPPCFRTFLQSPHLTLTSVIENAFLGDNLRHALAILGVPPTADRVPSFLEEYFRSTSSFDFPRTREKVLELYRIYNRIAYFVDRYFKDTMQQLGLSDQSPQDVNALCEGQATPLLSVFERTRLQRALLRFELYCAVFPGHESDPYGPDNPPPRDHPAGQQFSLFLANLAPWEVEEMCCIEQYFSSLIGEFIDELEEELINAVMTAPGAVLPSSLTTSQSAAEEQTAGESPNLDNLVDFKDLDLTDLLLFSRDGRHSSPRYISYVTSLGLNFIHNLAESDVSKRAELIGSNHPVERDFLPEALLLAPRGRTEHEGGNPTTVVADQVGLSRGYSLFRNATEDITYMGNLTGFSYSALRQLGYVFWDADRIQSPQVSEKLVAAKEMRPDELRLRFDGTRRKSAEERLRGTQLPRDQMERLERKYGTTLFGD